MRIHDVLIEDTHAEAFRLWAARLVITAVSEQWARIAAVEATGYGASIIGCDAEAGIEQDLSVRQPSSPAAITLGPDGRPAVIILIFARDLAKLTRAVQRRVGQCIMTCPTTAVYDGWPKHTVDGAGGERLTLGKYLSYFGDGHQTRQKVHDRDCWDIPVMDGGFIVEDSIQVERAIGGGNFLICGRDANATLAAAGRAAEAIGKAPHTITPFPGGVVRCGSKVGSRYKNVVASTHDAYCPLLREKVASKLMPNEQCVYEIVIDGLTRQSVASAMRAGILAACRTGAGEVLRITASQFAGRLGAIRFHLHDVVKDATHSS